MVVYTELQKQYDEMSFVDKIKLIKSMNDLSANTFGNYEIRKMEWDGYLEAVQDKAVRLQNDEYYVYIWRHAWGGPFYVGSGKNDRWLTKNGRCNDFYLHLDQADAVVYKVLDGVDSHTARLFEKYVSVNLIEAGYTLVNGDNNIEYLSEEARKRRVDSCKQIDGHELAEKVQKATLDILYDKPKCDYRITDMFLMEYGADYFSKKYIWSKNRVSQKQEVS